MARGAWEEKLSAWGPRKGGVRGRYLSWDLKTICRLAEECRWMKYALGGEGYRNVLCRVIQKKDR